jgi:splicing factor 3B subunit 3
MDITIMFNPREMKNLLQCDEILSLGCVTDFIVNDLSNEGIIKIYALCGNSSRSSLKVIKQGLSITDIANTTLPGKPTGIWTIKGAISDIYDKYIIVSFSNETLILSVDESSIYLLT